MLRETVRAKIYEEGPVVVSVLWCVRLVVVHDRWELGCDEETWLRLGDILHWRVGVFGICEVEGDGELKATHLFFFWKKLVMGV